MNEQVIITLPSLPTPEAQYANKVYRLAVVGADDAFYVCKREAAGTFVWVQIDNTGGGGGGLITAIADTASIDLTETAGTLTAAAIFGTTAGTVATGNHTHTNDHVPATVLDTASIDLSISGQQISAAAIFGTTATTVAAGNHTHTATGAQTVSDTASIDLTLAGTVLSAAAIFGTTATTIAAGNHTHTATGAQSVSDTTSIDLTLAGTVLSAAAIFAGTGAASTVARSDHDHNASYSLVGHTHSYQPLDADLTTIAGLADPNADRILFWDDSANAYAYLAVGTGLSITGTSLDATGGGGGAPTGATYITQTADGTLSAEQALDGLATGMLKNTTGTGVLSIGVAGTDYASASHTHALDDMTDVGALSGLGATHEGKSLIWDGTTWEDKWQYVATLGPWYGLNMAATANQALQLAFMGTTTATIQFSAQTIRAGRTGWIVGGIVVANADRTAGTLTVQPTIGGVAQTLASGGLAISAGTANRQWTTMVAAEAASGAVQIASGGNQLGVNVNTSGFGPITLEVVVWLFILYSPI